MSTVNFGYIDSELKRVDSELERVDSEPDAAEDQQSLQFWRHMHWGYFADPEVEDDSPPRALAAAEALTERILAAAGVDDGQSILDVGCGFGGTLDSIRTKHTGCRLVGINIDFRQVQGGRGLVAAHSQPTADPISFITADGCKLPLPDGVFDRVLALECIFHFPSRKAFFREVARVLKPGGTLALSDFVVPSGSLPAVWATMAPAWVDTPGDDGGSLAPSEASESSALGSPGRFAGSSIYTRLSRIAGFEVLQDEDITAHTVPTYAFLRRMHHEANDHANERYAEKDLLNINGLEALSMQGDLQYRVLSFRKP